MIGMAAHAGPHGLLDVALVVIAVGMLGIAGLYLSSLQSSRSAKLRAQAVQLAGSIADRIRANRDAVMAYNTADYGGEPADIDCETRRCEKEELAQDDLAEWIADIQATLPGWPRFPFWREKIWRSSDTVRLALSVTTSTRIAAPPGP